ncbi:MAG: hypothetical protein MUP70_03045, partial [Candidatus Aminicenantes bacterium]|nr:hypothetical protein [Candidatus Aminicenantes bacterium]
MSSRKNISGKKSWAQRLRRVFFITMSALLFLVLGAHIILHSSGFRSFVLKRTNQYLQNSYGLTLEVESYHYNLWRLRLSARGIRIQSKEEGIIPLENGSIDS